MSLEAFFLKAAPDVLCEIILQAGNNELTGINEANINRAIDAALTKYGLIGKRSAFASAITTALIQSGVINSNRQFTVNSPFLIDPRNVIVSWFNSRLYKIASVYSDMVLGIEGQSINEGARIQQLDPSGGIPTWKIVPVGTLGQPYLICSSQSEKLLTAGGKDNGNPLQQWTYNKQINQQWIILPTNSAGSTFKIISVYSGMGLDVDTKDASRKTARIQQWQHQKSRDNQLWQLIHIP